VWPPHEGAGFVTELPAQTSQSLEKLVFLVRVEGFREAMDFFEGGPAYAQVTEDKFALVR
jgi:hypothetical protein